MSSETKAPHTRQIIITCAPQDADDMERVLAGMRVHSDFNVLRSTEIMRWSDEVNPLPVLPMWVGFAHPGFAWDTFAGLLASVEWKEEWCVGLFIESNIVTLKAMALDAFFLRVREGKIA